MSFQPGYKIQIRRSILLPLLLLAFFGITACGPAETGGDSGETFPSGANDVAGEQMDAENEAAAAPDSAGESEVQFIVDPESVMVDRNGIEVGFTSDGQPYKGNPNAPVLMEEFSDYQCPFCARFSAQTMNSLIANQVADGELVIVFYDFPLTNLHPQAVDAAIAARCAGEQSAAAYWDMHDTLFINIQEWGNSNAREFFRAYAADLALDSDRFNSCLENATYQAAVEEDLDFGRARGVGSTPSFFLNGQMLVGAQPLDTFNEAIAQVGAGETAVAAAPPSPVPIDPADIVAPTPVPVQLEATEIAFALGDPDAPVTIVEFTDYQCPFCQRHALETWPLLKTQMVDSGRVYYVFKDLPLDQLHPQARTAAIAARCAGAQGAYLEMHEIIFSEQSAWSGTELAAAEAYFLGQAQSLRLDTDAFAACQASNEQVTAVQRNFEEALRYGFNGTPAFLINGYPLSGARPYETFEYVIELAENDELADAIMESMRQAAEAAAQPTAPPRPSGPVDIPIGDSYGVGDPDAPIVLVEYTDFQCPFCARHFTQTFPNIKENFIDTGVVYYVFKDFPLTNIHPQAVKASEAARCAGDQDAYLEMHTLLFNNQDEWSGQRDVEGIFNEYAATIGLDVDEFAGCLASGVHETAVLADLNEGIDFGVTGTPAFFFNGLFMSGAQPYETFVDAIAVVLERLE
jgi:protein-disulfide isomerase